MPLPGSIQDPGRSFAKVRRLLAYAVAVWAGEMLPLYVVRAILASYETCRISYETCKLAHFESDIPADIACLTPNLTESFEGSRFRIRSRSRFVIRSIRQRLASRRRVICDGSFSQSVFEHRQQSVKSDAFMQLGPREPRAAT